MTTFTRLVDWSVATDGTLKRWQRVPSVVPTAPGVPTNVALVSSGTTADVSWAAPTSNGGSAITGYTVKRIGGSTQSVGATTFTAHFTGLTAGQPYQFSVAAVNAIGTGPAAIVTNSRFPGDTNPKQTGRLFMGASVKGGGSPSPWESASGVPFGIRHRYWNGTTDISTPNGPIIQAIKEDHAAGRLPLVGWHIPGSSWGAAAAGSLDSQLAAFFDVVEQLAKPTFIIVSHEPEGGNGNGQPDGVAADYKAWMNRFRSRLDAYRSAHPGQAHKLVFCGCLMAATFTGGNGGIATWWPGDGVFDVLGLDGYAWDPSYSLPSGAMTAAMKYCALHNQPFGWSEYGVVPTDAQGGAKITNLYNMMTSGSYDCVFLAYFSVDGPAWQINPDNGTYQAFISQLRNTRSIHMSDLGF